MLNIQMTQTMRDLIRLCEREAFETPEFRQWFGHSKVVDHDGHPLLCHHGTQTSGIEAFRPLTHFGSLRAATSMSFVGGTGKPNMHTVYLRIERPCVLNDNGETTEDQLEDWAPEVFTDAETRAFFQASFTGEKIFHRGSGTYSYSTANRNKLFVELMKKHGYDGICYTNKKEDAGHMSWIIFDADQVWKAS
jgi:hypothetical protein